MRLAFAHFLPSQGRAPSRIRPLLALGLAVALLWAQWLGALHRVEHATGPQWHTGAHVHAESSGVLQAPKPTGAATGAYHSCVLFDGLCIADALPSAPSPGLVSIIGRHEVPAEGFQSWRAALARHYLSRAPPRV